MSVVLYRIDERLIHGQVVIGWGSRLHPDRIVVVDDGLAVSPWEQELYGMGVPDGVQADFEPVETALERLPGWQSGGQRVMILTRDIPTMNRLAATGLLRGEEVNIGGLHHAPGRKRVLRYLFLSDRDRDELLQLSGHGVQIEARDVPGGRSIGLEELVRVR